MTVDQKHVCEVHLTADGVPFLAFAPSSGVVSSYSNSLFTLDLRPGASTAEARQLADQINALVWGVSATIF